MTVAVDTQTTSVQSDTATSTQGTAEPKTLSSPGLSFTEYETLRRGGTLPEERATTTSSAPEARDGHEQKTPSESETEETESKGSESIDKESDEESETESKDESDKEETETSEKPKKKGGFQRRIDKLNQRMAAREQELEYWKQQATRVAGNSKSDAPVEKTEASAKAADGKPDPDKFQTHAEYVEALTDWKTEQKLQEREQKQERAKLQSEHEKVVKTYVERKEAFKKKVPDFDAVISEVEHIPVSPAVREIILLSENGPELAYELAKNEDEHARICKLPPLAAAREMGKLEAKIAARNSADKKPETKKITSAPKPLETVKGSGKGTAHKSINDPGLSFADYERLRREQLNKGRRA